MLIYQYLMEQKDAETYYIKKTNDVCETSFYLLSVLLRGKIILIFLNAKSQE